MPSLFVSHSSQDAKETAELVHWLRAEGFELLFIDFDPDLGVPAGRNWEEELHAQLRRADGVVYVASPASEASRWCFAELSIARAMGKRIFPVLVAGTERLALLADVQWVDVAVEGERAYRRLLEGLRRLLPAHQPATSQRPEATAIGTLEGAGNDTIGDEDQLGFQSYVKAFADLITSPHSKPPLTIGIFGSWGMGKSFLLSHIEREILTRDKDRDVGMRDSIGPRVHVVRFNAWEYSASAVVWPGLVRKIVRKLDEDVPWPWYKRYWTRLRWNLPRELERLRSALVAAALVLIFTVVVLLWRDLTVAAAVAAVLGSLGLAGLVKAASNPLARWITALFEDGDYGRTIGFMEEIKHDLEILERRLHEKGDPTAPVVGRVLVLIDDLDRCEPEKSVEVLQAVNLLLNFNSFVVCLGIDARIVTGAVEKHYQGLLGDAGASGYEYLDKIVQIPFRIPSPSEEEIRAFLARQLSVHDRGTGPEPGDQVLGSGGQAPSPLAKSKEPSSLDAEKAEAAVAFTWPELQAFERLVPYLRPNPRHLKRLVNVYRLVRALARTKQEDAILLNPAATIRWLVMWSQWPYTSQAMLDRFDEILAEQDGSPSEDAATDPLRVLLEEVTPKLNPVRDRLDDDADSLTKVLDLDGCRLSWAEIGRIRRYTVNFNPAVVERIREARS